VICWFDATGEVMRINLRLTALFLTALGVASLAVWLSNSGGYGESPVTLVTGAFLLGLAFLLWMLKRN
jgi:hypothetical protein